MEFSMLQASIELFKRTMNEWLIRNVSWAERYFYYKRKDPNLAFSLEHSD